MDNRLELAFNSYDTKVISQISALKHLKHQFSREIPPYTVNDGEHEWAYLVNLIESMGYMAELNEIICTTLYEGFNDLTPSHPIGGKTEGRGKAHIQYSDLEETGVMDKLKELNTLVNELKNVVETIHTNAEHSRAVKSTEEIKSKED